VTSSAVTLRPATRDDADDITDVQVASWRAGYAHVFPESILYADDFDSSRREFWTAWRFAPGHRIAVATVGLDVSDGGPGERVVGFASYGPERERARGFTGRGELWAFYLHPDVWGSGVADRLIDHAEHRLAAEGFDTAVLWVLDDNPRARRFYERHGWAASGISAAFDQYCAVSVPEIEYRKQLRGAS
jgi:ribosomal protein S18 acetylase RimI-like enzyme